ncbi:MAG: response regulator [Fibrobacterota bacterium]
MANTKKGTDSMHNHRTQERDTLLHELLKDSTGAPGLTEALDAAGEDQLFYLLENDMIPSRHLQKLLSLGSRSVQVGAIEKMAQSEQGETLLINALGGDDQNDFLLVKKVADTGTATAVKLLLEKLAVQDVRLRDFIKAEIKRIMNEHFYSILFDQLLSHIDHPNMIISILDIIGSLKISEAEPYVRRVVQVTPKSENVRAVAYATLRRIAPKKNSALLADGLFDGSDEVAFAVGNGLQNESDKALIAGMYNMLESGVYPAGRLAEVLVFTNCESIVESLSGHESFRTALRELLQHRGMEAYRKRYLSLFEDDIPLTHAVHSSRGVIWAVDDERFILKKYERFAVKMGYPLETFMRAEEALDRLCRETPTLVFADLNMPGMNGVEFAEKARSLCPEVPVVLVTTQEEARSDPWVDRASFHAVINKPFDMTELNDIIQGVLR